MTDNTEQQAVGGEDVDFVAYAESLGYRNPMYLPQPVKDCISKSMALISRHYTANDAIAVATELEDTTIWVSANDRRVAEECNAVRLEIRKVLNLDSGTETKNEANSLSTSTK